LTSKCEGLHYEHTLITGGEYAEARAIIADALVMGKVLKIQGGHFDMPPRGRGRHRRGKGGGF